MTHGTSQSAQVLAELGRDTLSSGVVPEAEAGRLRDAAETLERTVVALTRILAGETRIAPHKHPEHAEFVMDLIGEVMLAAYAIGNSHDSRAQQLITRRRAAKTMREAKASKSKITELELSIYEHQWTFKLADSDACAKKVRKALGRADVSLMTVRRAIMRVKQRFTFEERTALQK
jgi:hypothetical protein